MAELTNQDRLQPSLLDRLIDNEPDQSQESRTQQVLSVRQLRTSVIRDLVWLLNTGNLEEIISLDDLKQVKSSVLNYGMRGLTGYTTSTLNTHEIERQLRQVILAFEPRILRNTLKVNIFINEEDMNQNAVQFEIEGDLWAQPLPLRLFMKTEIDLETGSVNISESGSQKIN